MVLFLNDIGTGEVMLVLVFILIFFGYKSIPGLARTFGQTIRKVKDASQEIQSEIKKSTLDMKSELDLTGIIQDTANDIKRPLDQYANDVEDVVSRRPIHSQANTPIIPAQTDPVIVPDLVENNNGVKKVDLSISEVKPDNISQQKTESKELKGTRKNK